MSFNAVTTANPAFFTDADYRRYLRDLTCVTERYQCRIHAYVLMTNHVHLLVSPDTEYAISQMMQALGRRYVCYVNKRYGRTGTLWEGRYKSCLIDSKRYLLTCMRYLELNPVRAGMVEHPGDYLWSSFHANAYDRSDKLLEEHSVYLTFALDQPGRRQTYRDLFRQHMDAAIVDQIRETLNHELVLGRSQFKDKIEQMTQRQTRLGKAGRPCVRETQDEYIAAG